MKKIKTRPTIPISSTPVNKPKIGIKIPRIKGVTNPFRLNIK